MSGQGSLSIERMCQLVPVSRAGFYRSLQEQRPVEEEMAERSAIQQKPVGTLVANPDGSVPTTCNVAPGCVVLVNPGQQLLANSQPNAPVQPMARLILHSTVQPPASSQPIAQPPTTVLPSFAAGMDE